MARTIASRMAWARTLVGLPDQQSRDLAATMATYTNPASPAARGGDRWEHTGLEGSDVREATRVLPYPLQLFHGVPVTRAGVTSGDLMGSSAPGTHTTTPGDMPLLWSSSSGRPPLLGLS